MRLNTLASHLRDPDLPGAGGHGSGLWWGTSVAGIGGHSFINSRLICQDWPFSRLIPWQISINSRWEANSN